MLLNIFRCSSWCCKLNSKDICCCATNRSVTKGSSETVYEPQINATDSDSPEQDLMSSEDLLNSFNSSPDSFAACSCEKKAEVASVVGQISPTCDVAFVATLPDDD